MGDGFLAGGTHASAQRVAVLKPWVSKGGFACFCRSWQSMPPEAGHGFGTVGSAKVETAPTRPTERRGAAMRVQAQIMPEGQFMAEDQFTAAGQFMTRVRPEMNCPLRGVNRLCHELRPLGA